MAEDKDGFLARWSKRKQAHRSDFSAEAEEEAPATDSDAAEEERLETELAEAEANRIAAEAVDLDEIEYGFDFSVFLKRGVPGLLRKTALRKFFNSNPILANLDGLNDYDEDYNNPKHMVYKSTWDVARGFLTESEKLLQQATGRLTQDEPPPQVLPETIQDVLADEPGETPGSDSQGQTAEVQSSGDPELEPLDEVESAAAASTADEAAVAPTADEMVDTELTQQKRVSIRQRLNG